MMGARLWLRIGLGILTSAASAAAFVVAARLARLADKLGTSPYDGPTACYLGICRRTERDIELQMAAARHPRPGDAISSLSVMMVLVGFMILAGALIQVACGIDQHWQRVTASPLRVHQQWRVPATRDLWLLAALMPAQQRERWLAEILSALHEAGPSWRRWVSRDYRANALRVLFLAWTAPLRRVVSRWLRASQR
jgi:hypothetical protein